MARKANKSEQAHISEGVKKMVRQWERTGKIKTSRATYEPENKEKAIKQALAIEYGEHKVGRAGDE